MASEPVLNSENISKITAAEKKITNSEEVPVKGGPTAQAQKHANQPINSDTLHDITEGEKKITGERVAGGPTSTAQSILGQARSGTSSTKASTNATGTTTGNTTTSATLDSNTISKITDAEKRITSDEPVKGGPSARAQKHANQPITSEVLHDITEAEKMITSQDGPVKKGPTAQAQSAISKGRS